MKRPTFSGAASYFICLVSVNLFIVSGISALEISPISFMSKTINAFSDRIHPYGGSFYIPVKTEIFYQANISS